MELRHLRYFVAAAEEENISRAALKLHVSQPGVSRQIRDLEEEVGFPLFERGAQSLRLTEVGRKFFVEARAVLQRADKAVAAARAIGAGAPGELRVGYAPSLTVEILPRALRGFQAAFPKVRVFLHDLSTEEILSGLRNCRLDAALTVRPPSRSMGGLSFRELAKYPIRVALAPKHPLAKIKALRLEQIANQPLVAYSHKQYPEYQKQILKIFSSARLVPRIGEEHDGVTSLIAAIEAGNGYALVPSCLACMAGPRLKLVPLVDPLPEIIVGAAWKGVSPSAVVSAFVAAASS